MKLTAPKTLDDYFRETEYAVRHLYAGLDSCWAYYEEATRHWNLTHVNQLMTPERRLALDSYLELAGKYFELKASEALFAGAILQAAYMAVRLFSRNTLIPASAQALVRPTQRDAIRFCIGPERHGVPLGLIIYAARNQYNHWDDERPRDVTTSVFNVLAVAFAENPFSDLAFDLDNPTIVVYANEVLLVALGWRRYEQYLAEMRGLLQGQ